MTHAGTAQLQGPVRPAQSLAGRLRRLLAGSTHRQHPYVELAVPSDRHRCCVCHRSGHLSGHRCADGRIQWVHRSCHRRLHRSSRTTS